MKIILMTDVPSLGRQGEQKDVATGYARNFLLPKKLAVPATATNLRNLDHLRRQRDREESRALETARVTATSIEGLGLHVPARASEDGRLYGSVSAQDGSPSRSGASSSRSPSRRSATTRSPSDSTAR